MIDNEGDHLTENGKRELLDLPDVLGLELTVDESLQICERSHGIVEGLSDEVKSDDEEQE